MVTAEEKRFADWWRLNRDKEKRVFRQWLIGLPIGLLFAVPIVINFASGWYKRADMWARGHTSDNTGVVLMVAILLIVTFIAIFYKRHKWDMYEQQYKEILSRMEAGDSEPPVENKAS